MQRYGFDPPLRRIFSGRGDFSLGVNMGSWFHSLKTLSDESVNRGLVCAHMHSIPRTQKILTFMSYGECGQQKHTQHAPFTKTECDYLNGWIKKGLHAQKSHPKWWTPKIQLVNAEEWICFTAPQIQLWHSYSTHSAEKIARLFFFRRIHGMYSDLVVTWPYNSKSYSQYSLMRRYLVQAQALVK